MPLPFIFMSILCYVVANFFFPNDFPQWIKSMTLVLMVLVLLGAVVGWVFNFKYQRVDKDNPNLD